MSAETQVEKDVLNWLTEVAFDPDEKGEYTAQARVQAAISLLAALKTMRMRYGHRGESEEMDDVRELLRGFALDSGLSTEDRIQAARGALL